MEEKPLYGALTVYRERGAYLRRLEQFEKAKASYDEGFKHSPQDVALLIGRSQVCADAMKPQQAYSDAEAALKLEPNSMLALNVQARAQYTMCDFERSVVMNYRGSRLRRYPPYFEEGIIQGLETLQDTIGIHAGHVLLDMNPIIKRQEKSNEEVTSTTPVHNCRIPRPKYRKKITQLEKRHQDLLSRVLAMKYLGPMAYDKIFLEELIHDQRVPSANASGSRDIINLAKDAYNSISERQEMLRAMRPYYTIKRAEKSASSYLTRYRQEVLEKERKVSEKNANRFIDKILDSLENNKLNEVIATAEQMQAFLDSRTLHTLPNKDIYTDRLYRAVGEGYLNMHRLSYRISEYGNRRRIAFLMGLPYGRPKSYDSVTASYSHKCVDVSHGLKKLEDLIDMCENNYMRCYLNYRMAQMQNTLKNYALAKFYAKRCQYQANELNSPTWWLNGCYVLMAGDMKQGNQNDIRIAVEQALEYSKLMADPESVQVFLTKCAELAASAVTLDDNKLRKQREAQILRNLDDVTKVEARVLFKTISRMPPGRRFEVLPRKMESSGWYVPVRRRRLQRGLTIVPGKERALPPMTKSSVPGFQDFRF